MPASESRINYRTEMADKSIHQNLREAKEQGKKQFAVLIDPDGLRWDYLEEMIRRAIEARVDYLFVGGSLVVNSMLDDCIQAIRQQCDLPIVLFPGSHFQINEGADAILFLSLISGRNPDLLIGQHVVAAPYLKDSRLEVLPTGYMLVDGGAPTTVSYISNTSPIPANKPDIALCTALAGELLGLKMIFLDAGSGAERPVSQQMIKTVSAQLEVPLLVGGGIKTPERAAMSAAAGADLIVVGNAFEKEPGLLGEMADAVHRVGVSKKEELRN